MPPNTDIINAPTQITIARSKAIKYPLGSLKGFCFDIFYQGVSSSLMIGHFEISERLMKIINDRNIAKTRMTNSRPRKIGIMKINEKITVRPS